ncbi:MAG: hypothetical protein MK132_12960 [Lentisphaerales bacterium]|nr:hypothetical protein [Lentisphaerales bacterium]
MDILTFISNIVSAVIWPLITLILVKQFNDPLAELILRISKIKHKDTVLDFDKKMDELKVEAQAEGLASSVQKKESLVEKERELNTVASIAPSAAIMETWTEVEGAVIKLVLSKGICYEADGAAPYLALQNLLLHHRLLENKKIKIYSDLRKLRNKVAHAADYEVNEDQAAEYISIAMNLVEIIETQKI